MFMRRVALPLMAKVKETTGMAVLEDEGYRSAVESFTHQRLKVCQEEEDWEMIEKGLGCGQVEKLVQEAQDELKLIVKMTVLRLRVRPGANAEGQPGVEAERRLPKGIPFGAYR
ncbi:hypothetical protein Nepgr_006986 [Nepenthes gracilis]|uniref:Uncharacterized protein n=1 Tax=Nepenthes gracilis TaxID=150966 RepID=A0AAD3XI38_NEPGR|nr:hypothetical protein Nepgr_006986 [Nepenthes gracilis]